MASRLPMPFSWSTSLGADPLNDLHREMNRLFEDTFRGSGAMGAGSRGSLVAMPNMDVHEAGNELCISAELPGVQASDVDVRLEGDLLIISGEKKNEHEQKERDYHLMERSYGRFQRSIRLPFVPVSEHIQADFKDGVLTVHVPRQAAQERSKRIEVRSGGEQQAIGAADGRPGQQPQGGTGETPTGAPH